MINIIFRPYCSADCQACTQIFDANCPQFFAPNERQEYDSFLTDVPEGYEVCEAAGRVCGAFGLFDEGDYEKRLNWILLDPQSQGLGIGLKIMERVVHLGRASETRIVRIAASHKSAPFFAKFGATIISSTKDGWGPDMDRVDMALTL
ncbi:MAG: GNAT family N-acetyltransferase [Pseudomonadales bacterium]